MLPLYLYPTCWCRAYSSPRMPSQMARLSCCYCHCCSYPCSTNFENLISRNGSFGELLTATMVRLSLRGRQQKFGQRSEGEDGEWVGIVKGFGVTAWRAHESETVMWQSWPGKGERAPESEAAAEGEVVLERREWTQQTANWNSLYVMLLPPPLWSTCVLPFTTYAPCSISVSVVTRFPTAWADSLMLIQSR